MKVGDLVKWSGFKNTILDEKHFQLYGIIVKIFDESLRKGKTKNRRLYILWSNGKLAKNIYPQTVSVIQSRLDSIIKTHKEKK